MLFYYIFILLSDDNIYVINIRYLIKRPLSSILIKLPPRNITHLNYVKTIFLQKLSVFNEVGSPDLLRSRFT